MPNKSIAQKELENIGCHTRQVGRKFQVDPGELISRWEQLAKLKEAGVAWTAEQENWWNLWGPDQWRVIG